MDPCTALRRMRIITVYNTAGTDRICIRMHGACVCHLAPAQNCVVCDAAKPQAPTCSWQNVQYSMLNYTTHLHPVVLGCLPGNTMTEATTNLGREVIAATSEGARAVAGSGVSDTADTDNHHPAITSTSTSFSARHVDNRGSHAFTDNGGTSAATTGQGNGPAALAFGAEVAAMSRSHRDKAPFGGPRDGFI